MKIFDIISLNRNYINYSSYPAASMFDGRVDSAVYSEWLHTIPKDDMISLFIKIPNGSGRAWVFPPKNGHNQRVITTDIYFDAVAREIAEVARRMPGRRTVTNIHVGGRGSLMNGGQLDLIMKVIEQHFHLAADIKISIELTPGDVQASLLKSMKEHRFNRGVIDVQDYDLKAKNAELIKSPSPVSELTEALKAIGVGVINLKLYYGLPYQTSETVTDSLRKALALKPARVSLSGYENVFLLEVNKNSCELVNMPHQHIYDMHQLVHKVMKEYNYRAIGIDNFVMPSDGLVGLWQNHDLKRYFQSYTDNRSKVLLGFGAGATTALSEGYVMADGDIAGYTDRVFNEGLAGLKGAELDNDDMIRRDIINNLMCYYETDVAAIVEKRQGDIQDYLQEFQVIDSLDKEEDLLKLYGFVIKLTDKGRPFARTLCSVFDRYLDNSAIGIRPGKKTVVTTRR